VAYGAYRARSADRARIPPRLSASALTVWEWEGGAAVAMRSDKEETRSTGRLGRGGEYGREQIR